MPRPVTVAPVALWPVSDSDLEASPAILGHNCGLRLSAAFYLVVIRVLLRKPWFVRKCGIASSLVQEIVSRAQRYNRIVAV